MMLLHLEKAWFYTSNAAVRHMVVKSCGSGRWCFYRWRKPDSTSLTQLLDTCWWKTSCFYFWSSCYGFFFGFFWYGFTWSIYVSPEQDIWMHMARQALRADTGHGSRLLSLRPWLQGKWTGQVRCNIMLNMAGQAVWADSVRGPEILSQYYDHCFTMAFISVCVCVWCICCEMGWMCISVWQ